MKNTTRAAFNAYMHQIATLNGIEDASTKFAVAPSVEQTLVEKMQESSVFLSKINILTVSDQQGEKLGLGVGSSIASTTDTSANDRVTQDPTDFDQNGYLCTQTNFDSHITYAKLDAWSKFPDFQQRIRNVVLNRIALDRITIGFNGTSRAATSDRVANPLLQDVNKGFLQKMREYDGGSHVMSGVATAGSVNVGELAGYDYKNLDALVFDVVNNLIDPWYRDDPQLVVIIGRELMADKYFPLISNNSNTPTEARALDLIIGAMRVGGVTAVQVPFFPSRSIAITRLDNLSIYLQEGSTRRVIMDNPKRDRIEDYQSANEAYVVEDRGCMAIVENIKLPNAAGTAYA
jgi:P2 family phage major capsid protein